MQLVVVRAVRNAVSAATTTFTASSITRFFVIVNFQLINFQFSIFNLQFDLVVLASVIVTLGEGL